MCTNHCSLGWFFFLCLTFLYWSFNMKEKFIETNRVRYNAILNPGHLHASWGSYLFLGIFIICSMQGLFLYFLFFISTFTVYTLWGLWLLNAQWHKNSLSSDINAFCRRPLMNMAMIFPKILCSCHRLGSIMGLCMTNPARDIIKIRPLHL